MRRFIKVIRDIDINLSVHNQPRASTESLIEGSATISENPVVFALISNPHGLVFDIHKAARAILKESEFILQDNSVGPIDSLRAEPASKVGVCAA